MQPLAAPLAAIFFSAALLPAGSSLANPQRPAGVPGEFIATPNGYFHPSCVVTVGDDEHLDRDLKVRGRDGSVRRAVAPCAYPRYSPLGRPIHAQGFYERSEGAASGRADHTGPANPAPFYDGWVAFWANNDADYPPGLTISDQWMVPPLPQHVPVTGDSAVVLYYFNGLQTDRGGTINILQPVLGFDGNGGEGKATWSIASWNCCVSGLQQTSHLVPVLPGDVILGTIVGTNCAADSTCASWAVTSTDLNSGGTTVLTDTQDQAAPYLVVPAVLEAYGVRTCASYEPRGSITFFDNLVTDGTGAILPLDYTLQTTGLDGSPDCAYDGHFFGDDFTLTYNTAVSGAPTQVELTSDLASLGQGQPVTLTAAVSAATAPAAISGTITFYDGTTSLGAVTATATSAGASASLTTSTLIGGARFLNALYSGDTNYQLSQSAPLAVTVAKWPTTIAVTSSAASASEGTAVTLTTSMTSTAAANGTPMSGSVIFRAGNTALTSAPLSSATATSATVTFTAGTLLVGSDPITATYSGDANHLGATSSTESITVAATLTIEPLAPKASFGAKVAFTAGTGVAPYSWSITTNGSGGTINALSGSYLAGPKAGADVIQVTDNAGASATTTVTVSASSGCSSGGLSGSVELFALLCLPALLLRRRGLNPTRL